MKKFIVKEVFYEASGNNTAGSKARIDIEYIAEKQGFHKFPVYLKKPGSEKKSIFKQVADHIYVYNTWKSALDEIEDAYLIIQFPIVNGFIFLKNLLIKLKKKKVKMSTGDKVFTVINTVIMILVCIAIVYPLYYVLLASVTDPIVVSSGKFLLYPEAWYTNGYETTLKYQPLWTGYANTIKYTVIGTLISLVCTIPAGYALSRYDMV